MQSSDLPLRHPVSTKINRQDYEALIDRTRVQKITPTALVRVALRQYLCSPLQKK